MNATISIIRIAILLVLGFVSLTLVLGEIVEGASLLAFLIGKVLGFVLLYGTAKLYSTWVKQDAWLKAIDSLCTYNEEND